MQVTLYAEVDNALGGRWTSLRTDRREWLWRRADGARASVTLGVPFVDAGGLEECVPTVRGTPDHGDAWSRPWDETGVVCPEFVLRRRVESEDGAVVADYELTAEPGYRFVWAAHALLDVSPAAHLVAPEGTPVLVTDPEPVLREWPAGLSALGPDDGTATGAVLERGQIRVVDGDHRLDVRVECADQPVSIALWRNLRGWPEGEPYRSVGVEPMLGRTFDRDDLTRPAAIVPADGTVRWRLTFTAYEGGTGSTVR
ncbi:hypothetical protein [Lentzea flava]|uniref:Galactose mutarotase n=1 Tax=Lentzea flava TaxID=103732 RepID=A0ABQ2UJ49_9PSEU|nr:hypothetical protein [Lentzea flava]MCP2199394.1 hypothetical protein [Lentzea flava]GGU35523.1 hypothetical protein GCM10010178_29650 [Lentzea flava]